MRYLVTGGCGFIGSNFVRRLLERRDDARVTVLDLLTYAGNRENLEDCWDDPRLRLVGGDVADPEKVRTAADGADVVVNFAAETHVDRSIDDAAPFLRTNVEGVRVLLEAVRDLDLDRLVQISTDEVYGSAEAGERFTEESSLAPNSPYSASKASADLLVRAYARTYDVPVVTARPSNAYGPYQFPEKLIPLMTCNALEREPLPVYGDGQHVREWIYVEDLCDALLAVVEEGAEGEIYNVGSGVELTNLELVRQIVEMTDAPESLIRFVDDRPGHDRRYAMDSSRLRERTGWEPRWDFREALRKTVRWYLDHEGWLRSVRDDEYRQFYVEHYRDRLGAAVDDGERRPMEVSA